MAEKRKSIEHEWADLKKRELSLSDKLDDLDKKEAEHKEAMQRAKEDNAKEVKRLETLQQKLEEQEKDVVEDRELLQALKDRLNCKDADCTKREEKLAKEKAILEDSIKSHREKMSVAHKQLDEIKKRREEEERLFAKVRTERETEERRTQMLAAEAKKAREAMLKSRVAQAREELENTMSEINDKKITQPGSEIKMTQKGEDGFGKALGFD
jgi:chromosome segregation ATPase